MRTLKKFLFNFLEFHFFATVLRGCFVQPDLKKFLFNCLTEAQKSFVQLNGMKVSFRLFLFLVKVGHLSLLLTSSSLINWEGQIS